MTPAQQGFETVELIICEGNDGLVVHTELSAFDCPAEVSFKLQNSHSVGMHFGVEYLVSCFAQRLCPVHGSVGIPDNFFRVLITATANCDANAGRGKDVVAAKTEWNA